MTGTDALEKCPQQIGVSRALAGLPTPVVCGKPVKRRGLCGVHARKLDNRERQDVEALERRIRADAAGALARRLRDRTGIMPAVRFSDGDLILTQADAETILAALPPIPPSKGDGPFLSPLGAI